jgi:hypothetical protein
VEFIPGGGLTPDNLGMKEMARWTAQYGNKRSKIFIENIGLLTDTS